MKLGSLPVTLEVNGKAYSIRTDYRDILQIILAFHDDDLSQNEKAYVLLKKIYVDLDSVPKDDIKDAYIEAIKFISMEKGELKREDKKKPQTVDWEKDDTLLFPAINKVAGFEVRAVQYMHWWTFMGYFQGISREDTYGFILSIRQKKAKRKKLEKYEQEFFNANRELCDLKFRTKKNIEDELLAVFNDAIISEGE